MAQDLLILPHIMTFRDPPCQLGQFLWFKLASTCVPQVVPYVLCSSGTSGRYIRPQKPILAKKMPFWLFLESFPRFRFGIYGAKRESKSTFQYKYTPSRKYGLLASKNDFQALGSDESS